MKVQTIDYIWAVLSFITVGVSFHMGYLLYGLLIIYVFMEMLFLYHIFEMKKRMKKTVAVYGTIMEYRKEKGVSPHYYPVVSFETENGIVIDSVYTIADKSQRYEIGDEKLICYDPDDPLFFYFADREYELTSNYYRYILFGSFPAVLVVILIFILRSA